MNAIEINGFVRRLLDDIASGRKVEDARVELKQRWDTDYSGKARRLAALCNAARSPWVLWVVGADEQGGFGPPQDFETGQWVTQVSKHFEGPGPVLLQDVKVPYGQHLLTALLFASDAAPYVWKIPPNQRSNGVEREVPWRRGTEPESARREDLIRLLAPLIAVPALELVYARLELDHRVGGPRYRWSLRLTLFIVPSTDGAVVLPSHKMVAQMKLNAGNTIRELRPMIQSDNAAHPVGLVTSSYVDVTARGPGTFQLLFYEQAMSEGEVTPEGDVEVEVEFGLIGDRPSTKVTFICERNGMTGESALWEASCRK